MTKRDFLRICRAAGTDPKSIRDWRRYLAAWLRVDKRYKK